MGIYLNPSPVNFKTGINSEIYVDKTRLITFTNKKINTQQKYICVSRPRRFGKSMAADMLAAYYGSGKDINYLFQGLKIATDSTYKRHLNVYDVIKIDMQSFLNKGKTVQGLLSRLTTYLVREIKRTYSAIDFFEEDDLSEVLNEVFAETEKQFVIIIDEWDCVMRRIHNWEEQKLYLDFLRDWLKDQPYVALAYMTGILPIKKYGEHSTLNMFREYSMINSAEISDCFGFTEEEVKELCKKYQRDFTMMKEWYDGYHLISKANQQKIEYSIYSPNSIVESIMSGVYDGYWNQTETYEALQKYIQLNMDGLKDSIIEMLAGNKITMDAGSFRNDMYEFHSKDEVLTLLVHLGYLTYSQEEHMVSIPNKEVAQEFIRSINHSEQYTEIADIIQASKDLLESLWEEKTEKVENGIEKVHRYFPPLQYNSELALSCVIELAFYFAREYYTVVREIPTGTGYADICYIPKPRYADKPALLIELKWNQSAETAIEQIKQKNYPHVLEAYQDNLLICGINYDKKNKKHICKIEKCE